VNILNWQSLCLHPREFYLLSWFLLENYIIIIISISSYNGRKLWFCDWLHIPREDGKPRVLILDDYNQHARLVTPFIQLIKKVCKIILRKEEKK
jgi:hypothetical protein